METHVHVARAETAGSMDLVDVTDEIVAAISDGPVPDGHVTVFAESSGCALIVNERESGLLCDIRDTMGRLGRTGREDLRSLLGSASIVLPLKAGRLQLGTWQRVMLAELEGPAERRIVVQIVGE
jgi:secondary thiamine-phosphate synthase enzyme